MKLLKKTILGLGIALFAIQPSQAGIFSRVSDFAKKHNKLTSTLAGLTAAVATYNIFPKRYPGIKVAMTAYLFPYEPHLIEKRIFDFFAYYKNIINPEYIRWKKDPKNYFPVRGSNVSPDKYIYSDEGKKLINGLTNFRILSSLVAGYLAYAKTNEYLEKNK